MDQDGKLEPACASEVTTGKILLTLSMLSIDESGYRHAVVPFPPSYEAACAEALKTFAAFIPEHTVTVTLRQAVQRKNGQIVWSMIPQDSWCTVLEKDGEEIGVFLPGERPESIPYEQVKKLVRFQFFDADQNGQKKSLVKAVGSIQDCIDMRDLVCKATGSTGYGLFYDERMVGTQAAQQLYRDDIEDSKSRPIWRKLDDPETFTLLVNRHPEPMAVCIRNPDN